MERTSCSRNAIPRFSGFSSQPPSPAQLIAGAAEARKPDLGYITPDAFAAAILYPRSILKSPQLELLPVEILSTVFKKEMGIDPVEIEQLIVSSPKRPKEVRRRSGPSS